VFEVSAEVGADEMAEQAELAARLSQNNVLAANNAPPDLATYDHQFSRLVLIEIYTPKVLFTKNARPFYLDTQCNFHSNLLLKKRIKCCYFCARLQWRY
jgi:hypothetical protein